MSELDLRRNPYVGLRPFFIDDSLYFFGREQQTAELLEILHRHRFLGVVGSSGSGKSSLVRAGLLPALLGGFLVEDRDRWRIVQMKPGDAPIGNLAAGLLAAMREPATQARDALEQRIRDGHTDAVVEFLRPRLENNVNVFLLVDQFEEIFALRGIDADEGPDSVDPARRKERALRRAEAADLVDLIMALANCRDLPIYVALTMRTDFLGDCDLFYGLPEALNRGRYLVPRMTRQQLSKAIAAPAMLKQTRIAPRLLDYLLNELGDRFDRLPVLQHALLRTWDAWERAGGVGSIDLEHYRSAGGLDGALDQDAEGALQGLDLGVTERVFKRLTDTDVSQRRVRSPARISELAAAAGAERSTVEGILRRFEEDGRSFVHPSDDGKPDDPRVDISHESLIRQWDRLRRWVDEERQWRDEYRELVKKARKREHDNAAPLQDPELQMVVDWRSKAAPSRGWAARYSVADGDFDSAMGYLDESLEIRCRNLAEAELQRRWKIWNGLILFIVAMVAAYALTEKAGVELQVRGGTNPSAVSEAAVDAAGPTPPAVQSGSTVASKTQESGSQKEAGRNKIEKAEKASSEIWEAFLKFWYLGFFVLIYFALAEGGRRIQRRFAYPVILRGFVSSGGRNSTEVKATAAERQDAVVVHHTTYASTLRRVAGYLIDLVVSYPAMVLGVGLVVMAGASELDDPFGPLITLLVSSIIGWLYEALQIASPRQATLGMRAVGIFRTDLCGERLSFARASAWYGYRLLSYLGFGLGFVVQPFTKKRQTFHDRMAGSVVLRRPPPSVAVEAASPMPQRPAEDSAAQRSPGSLSAAPH